MTSYANRARGGEADVPEGCVCGHGAYNHGYDLWSDLLGQGSRCIRCDCMEFRRAC